MSYKNVSFGLLINIINVLLVSIAFLFGASNAFASTLEDVKKRDVLQCGVSAGLPGFSSADAEGNWMGLDVDICKALAAAVLGDSTKVKFYPLTEVQKFSALQAGDIDVLAAGGGWTLSSDTALGLSFVGASYFGDQGFMAHQSLGVQSIDKMKTPPTVCMQDDIILRHNLSRFFQGKNPEGTAEYKTIIFRTPGRAVKAFDGGRCDVLFGMKAYLQGLREYLSNVEEPILLDDVVAREVHGPVVRQDDYLWFSIVRWTLFTLLKSEEYGLNSTNVDKFVIDEKKDMEHLLGGKGGSGLGLGLSPDWMYQIVRQVGNYGEIFDANVGEKSPFQLHRGLNNLWLDGGLHYSPAFQ